VSALAACTAVTLSAVQLSWNAPSGCPAATELEKELETAGLDGAASATVTESAGGFLLELEVNGARRSLTTPTCAEAAHAAVFFVRVGLEHERPAVEAPAPPPPPPPPAPAWSIGVSAIAAAGLVALPRPLARFGVSVRLQRGAWAGTLEATSSLAQRFAGGPTATSGATLREPLDAQLGACRFFDLAGGWLTAAPCLHLAVTWFSATGDNVSDPRSTSAALWSAGPGARVYLTRLQWLEVFVAGAVRFGSRPSVSFQGTEPFVEGSPVSLEVGAGAGVRF
jgi:hypothetical protein